MCGTNFCVLFLIRFRYFWSFPFSFDQTMVSIRVQPLYSMASSQSHDHICQKAFSISSFCVWTFQSVKEKMGVTSLGRHLRPACTQGFHAVIKTMWKMQIQLLCACVLYSMGSRVKPCPNMGIVTSHKSHGRNARFWLVERKFAALWLVTTYWSHHDYSHFQQNFTPLLCFAQQEVQNL